MKSKLVAMIVLAFSAITTNAAVIDFESVSSDDFGSPQEIEGFVFDFDASGWLVGPTTDAFYPDGTTNGTSILVASGNGANGNANVTMSQVGGGAFDIFNLDAASSNLFIGNSLEVTGSYSGGGVVSVILDNLNGTFSNYSLSSFENLVSVTFTSVTSGGYNEAGFALDNLSLSPTQQVSEPSMLALLGLALVGAGFIRRNSKA